MFSEHFPSDSFLKSKEQLPLDAETIKEGDFAAMKEIGGYFRGSIEEGGKRHYEYFWKDFKVIRNWKSRAVEKVAIETKAYGEEESLEKAEDIKGFRVTLEVGALEEHGPISSFTFELSPEKLNLSISALKSLAPSIHESLGFGLESLTMTNEEFRDRVQYYIDEWIEDYSHSYDGRYLGTDLDGRSEDESFTSPTRQE